MPIEKGLDLLLQGQYNDALALFERCEQTPPIAKLSQLAQLLLTVGNYASELSKGNHSTVMPKSSNGTIENLRGLHTNLKRLSRQLLMASTGYPVPSIDYMGDMSAALNYLLTKTFNEEQENKERREYDNDTGLLNRRGFVRSVYDILQARPTSVGILLCYGLDNLKYINTAHGFAVGDMYINKVVETLESYSGETHLIARIGGNEFAMYAHGFDSDEAAFDFANNAMLHLYKTLVILPNEDVKIRASCGFCIYPHDATTSDILMSYASHARVEVQNINRGTLMRFSPDIYRSKAASLKRVERLGELIEEKLFYFDFQPIFHLKSNTIFGYEALMRPKTADFSGPLEILSLAEAQSKLHQLEKVTFEAIFDWIYNNFSLVGDRKIFFNTVSTNFLDKNALRAIHPQYELIASKMVFEILETVTAETMLLQKVNALRNEMSALIAIDDFGCGHSNALRLINISPDILKIDSFFIRSINIAPASKNELLANILAYCRTKGILTLAEGVETQEELETVMQIGFDYVQGFYLGRPEKPLSEIPADKMAIFQALSAKYLQE